jgi:hypothetical protein
MGVLGPRLVGVVRLVRASGIFLKRKVDGPPKQGPMYSESLDRKKKYKSAFWVLFGGLVIRAETAISPPLGCSSPVLPSTTHRTVASQATDIASKTVSLSQGRPCWPWHSFSVVDLRASRAQKPPR